MEEKRIIRKIEFERMLNEQPFPEVYKRSCGGKAVPRKTTGFGSWLKRCHPLEFEKLYTEYLAKNNGIPADVKNSDIWTRVTNHNYGGV